MKRIFTSLILSLAIHGLAGADALGNDLQSTIRIKAATSKRGVIVAVTEPGPHAADAAWLLSQQTRPDSGYVPYLLVVSAEQRKQIYRELRLPDNSSPALLFFDRTGHEISRVIGVRPAHTPWQRQSETDVGLLALLAG
jgi:hypothetical protein